MGSIDELGSYDRERFDEEKNKKLCQTLSEAYKPIEMLCYVTQLILKDVLNAINDEIDRNQRT